MKGRGHLCYNLKPTKTDKINIVNAVTMSMSFLQNKKILTAEAQRAQREKLLISVNSAFSAVNS